MELTDHGSEDMFTEYLKQVSISAHGMTGVQTITGTRFKIIETSLSLEIYRGSRNAVSRTEPDAARRNLINTVDFLLKQPPQI